MNFISHCLSAPQRLFSSFKEDFCSLSNRDKRIVFVASIAFGVVALATRRVMVAVSIACGLSAAYYIFKHCFSKKIDLRPQTPVVPKDLRPTIVPQSIDLRLSTENLTVENLPVHAYIQVTKCQLDALQIDEMGISKHADFEDSYFLVHHYRYVNETEPGIVITRVPRIQEGSLPNFTPVSLSLDQFNVLKINGEGISAHDCFKDSYLLYTGLDITSSSWKVVRIPRLQEKDFPKFTSVTLNNDQYLSLRIRPNGTSSRTCFANFKFNCRQLPNGDWIVSR